MGRFRMTSIILLRSPDRGTPLQTFSLDMGARSQLVIGRQKDTTEEWAAADIVIDDGENSVSRHHAVFTIVRDRYLLRNTGRNDTYLNNVRHGPDSKAQPLDDGDLVRICGFYFRVQDRRPNRPPPLPPPLLRNLPPVPPDKDDSSTIQFSVGTSAAQKFLESAPAARLRTLLDISAKLAGTLELDKLLPEITEVLFAVFEQADRAFVFQLDEAGEPVAKSTRSRDADADVRFSRTIVRNCLRDMKACLCLDASVAPDLQNADSIAGFGIHSFMCVPFATASGAPLGALQLDTHDARQKFRDDDLMFLTVVAKLVAMALERAQLHADLMEVEFAKKVQMGFLPSRLPEVPGYHFYAFYNAAKIVGGDYYDFIELPGGRLAILVGDVSGKGVPASLLMAKLGAEARFCMLAQPDPAKAVAMLNDNLIRGGIGEKYVTLAAVVLDPEAHAVTVVTAGHYPPMRYRHATGEFGDFSEGTPNSYALGWETGYVYEARQFPLAAGETLLLFTDGVTDAVCPKSEAMFGLDGIAGAMAAKSGRPAPTDSQTMGERIVEAVKKHVAGRAQIDDIALVCFGRHGAP